MSLAGSQQKVFLRLATALRPHWRRDRNFPSRVGELFAANRAFGSRDRRLYRELIFTTLRFLPWVEPLFDSDPALAVKTVAWLAADLPATRAFRAAACDDWPACPATVAGKAAHLHADAAALLPEWLVRHCPEAGVAPNLDTLHTRAPLWLRLQGGNPEHVLAEFTANGWAFRRSEILPAAVELLAEADLTKTNAFLRGLVEVQDLGSQLILESVGIIPGGRWLDACAGAGGKTLQLAALVGAAGHVEAHDIREQALRELGIRVARAGLTNVTTLSASPAQTYDGVLVDAPCSGTGTWRRAPHLKWTTTAAQVVTAAEEQLALLTKFSALVRPGGQLVYATCSLSHFENEDVVAAFLATHSEFRAEALPHAPRLRLTPRDAGYAILPATHNTDGFYVAAMRRRGAG